jgi:hypothetical protein
MGQRHEQVGIRLGSLLIGIGGLLIFLLALASCLVVQALTTDAT